MSKKTRIPEEVVVNAVAQGHDIDTAEARVIVQSIRAQYPRASKVHTAEPRPLTEIELFWVDQQLQAMAAAQAS